MKVKIESVNWRIYEVQPINCKRCLAILKETGQ